MIQFQNDCCDCETSGYPCLGDCGLTHNPHYYCDECGEEFDPNELYKYDSEENMLCADCLLEKFQTVV